ncbi:pilus assembly protein TadB [Dehalobacter sp. TeCB1]|uniref:type II secretion system F family protein n=1 Tax=Dehalobacter sp. TeCB1 TaxID=1843715 RepID=UPI001FA7E6DC|nr:pilus assembly protein TadB [Dehalobacter sp. TeCB1]
MVKVSLYLCYGVSIGLLIIVVTWYLGSAEKKKLQRFISKRVNYLQYKINKDGGSMSKLRAIFNQRKQVVGLKIKFATFMQSCLLFFILAFICSFFGFSEKIQVVNNDAVAILVRYNVLGTIIITIVGAITPWILLNLVYYSTRKAINKQALNAFNLILNNYIVRNNIEAATWDSIEAMPFQMRSLFLKIQSEVNSSGKSFDRVLYDFAKLLNIRAFMDFYNVVVSAKLTGGSTEDLMYRLTDKIRSKKNRAQSIKEDMNPLITKAIVFTGIMVLTYIVVCLFWPEPMSILRQSSYGPLYVDAIIVAVIIEVALLLKFLSMDD